MTLIELDSGKQIEVRQLGLFELIPFEDDLVDPDFYYDMRMATGQTIKQRYNLDRALQNPPQPPEKPLEECEEDTTEHDQWILYQTFEAAKAHREIWLRDLEEYIKRTRLYILSRAVGPEDQLEIKTAGDMLKVVQAATVPQLTMEVIESTLDSVFQS